MEKFIGGAEIRVIEEHIEKLKDLISADEYHSMPYLIRQTEDNSMDSPVEYARATQQQENSNLSWY